MCMQRIHRRKEIGSDRVQMCTHREPHARRGKYLQTVTRRVFCCSFLVLCKQLRPVFSDCVQTPGLFLLRFSDIGTNRNLENRNDLYRCRLDKGIWQLIDTPGDDGQRPVSRCAVRTTQTPYFYDAEPATQYSLILSA